MRRGKPAQKLFRKLKYFVRGRADSDWNENMQAAAAGSFWKGNEVERVQHFLHQQPRMSGIRELSRTRIEIETHPVRFRKSLGAAPADVHWNTAMIRQG